MKFKSLTLVLLCISFIGFIACNNEANSKKPKATKKTQVAKNNQKKNKKKSSVKMLTQVQYWTKAKSELKLTDKQIVAIKAQNAANVNKINSLKKSKKWSGKANLANRNSVITENNSKLSKLLGTKAKAFNDYRSKYGIKSQKTKKKKSSNPGTKKKKK